MSSSTALYFEQIRRMVYQQCGVMLEPDKEYLMDGVLQNFLEKWGFESMSELMTQLWGNPAGQLGRQVVESLVPAETYFFRDPDFFSALEKRVIPDLVEKRDKTKSLSIWSAACSTGQEAYSLLFLLMEKFPFLFQWDLRVTASDFSRTSLAKAREGRYTEVEVQRGLPPICLAKYFHPLEMDWQVNDELRSIIRFEESNLKDPAKFPGPVDLLLLRNVLIYFDLEMKKSVLLDLHKALRPDGYLFLGASETPVFLDKGLEGLPMEGSITGYRLKG